MPAISTLSTSRPWSVERVDVLTPIPGLWGTSTYRLAVELYRRHRAVEGCVCVSCHEVMPCPSRRDAILVMVAAGEGAGPWDARPVADAADVAPAETGEQTHEPSPETPMAVPAYVGGYSLGGRGRRGCREGMHYDRYGT